MIYLFMNGRVLIFSTELQHVIVATTLCFEGGGLEAGLSAV